MVFFIGLIVGAAGAIAGYEISWQLGRLKRYPYHNAEVARKRASNQESSQP